MQHKETINISFSQKEEEKEIEEALKTPFDIVISILTKVKSKLQAFNDPLEREVEWVIKIIHSKRLYSFQGLQNASKIKQSSMEMKSLLGYLNQCSETKTLIEGFGKKPFQTTKIKKFTTNLTPSNFFQKRAKSVIVHSEEEKDSSNNTNNKYLLNVDEKILFDNNNDSIDLKQEEFVLQSPPFFRKIMAKKSEQLPLIDEKDLDTDYGIGINGNEISDCDGTGNNNKDINIGIGMGNTINNESNRLLLLSSMSFDIFRYFEHYGDKAFEYGAYGILSNFPIEKYSSTVQLKNFITEVKNNYSKDAYYHNEMHGLDVLQTIFIYISHTSLASDVSLNEIDILSVIIGALVHDLGHSGYNNDFQIKTQSELARRYNDRNVLENYHISKAFEILHVKDTNILEKIGKEEYGIFRKRMIELILSTDMLFHSKICSLMKSHISTESGKIVLSVNHDNIFEEQQDILNFILHAADIGHCSKNFSISVQWTQRINKEFWRQGDYEKEHQLPLSFLCDRESADVPRSQIGFIKGIIIPTFDLLTLALPELNYYKENVNNNLSKWGELIKDDEEKEKEDHNKRDEKMTISYAK